MNARAWLQDQNDRRTLTQQWKTVASTCPEGAPGYTPHVNELVGARVPSGAWGSYQNLTGSIALSTHRVVVLHSCGLTPLLCQRWLDQQDQDSTFFSVTFLASEVEAMVDGGVPAKLAGLYALAGYHAEEALRSHRKDAPTATTLKVQAQLAL